MARIGLDIDGVAYNFVDALRLWIHQSEGIPLDQMPPATRWEFYEDWGFTLQEYLAIMADGVANGDLFWRGDIYDGCKEVIDYLYHIRKDEIVFVTSRNIKGNANLARLATYHWLNNEAHLPYDELIMSDDKYSHGLDILFDDAPYQHAKENTCGVVFDQLWNEHLTDLPRVKGWLDLRKYVEEKFPVRNTIVI